MSKNFYKALFNLNVRMTKICVLHFSDLHFGEQNILQFMDRRSLFENFYYNLRRKINEIIDGIGSIKLAIISGDLGSLGHIPRDSDFMKFFELFFLKNIPVLTCPGNHDIYRELIQDGNAVRQFLQYISKIRALEF